VSFGVAELAAKLNAIKHAKTMQGRVIRFMKV
jgi:hypothetical protein